MVYHYDVDAVHSVQRVSHCPSHYTTPVTAPDPRFVDEDLRREIHELVRTEVRAQVAACQGLGASSSSSSSGFAEDADTENLAARTVSARPTIGDYFEGDRIPQAARSAADLVRKAEHKACKAEHKACKAEIKARTAAEAKLSVARAETKTLRKEVKSIRAELMQVHAKNRELNRLLEMFKPRPAPRAAACAKHPTCQLHFACCICSDKRPIRKGYIEYIDGEGDCMTATRHKHYCSACQQACQ